MHKGSWFVALRALVPQEKVSLEEAKQFPIYGSAVLLGLFLVLKYLPAHWINIVVTGTHLRGLRQRPLTRFTSVFRVDRLVCRGQYAARCRLLFGAQPLASCRAGVAGLPDRPQRCALSRLALPVC